jgi:hypothetical protein
MSHGDSIMCPVLPDRFPTKQELACEWLPRYTGMPIDEFGDYILLTNFSYTTRGFSNGVKTAKSDARVTREWTELHLQIGIEAMTEIGVLGEPIKHFTY